MNFEVIARNLLKPSSQTGSVPTSSSQNDFLQKLIAAGFSDDEILQCIREEYNNADSTSDRKQLLDMIVKMRGLYVTKTEERMAPIININVKGDNQKLFHMLCPSGPVAESEGSAA